MRKKIVAFLLLLALCLSSAVAGAATMVNNGLQITLTTNQKTYEKGDQIQLTVSVTNNGTKMTQAASVSYQVPGNCQDTSARSAGSLIPALDVGETASVSKSYRVAGDSVLPQTGDNSHVLLWLALCVLSAVFAVRIGHKMRQRIAALLLCIILTASMLPLDGTVSARAETTVVPAANVTDALTNSFIGTITVSEDVFIMGRIARLIATITFGGVDLTGVVSETILEMVGEPLSQAQKGFINETRKEFGTGQSFV